MQLTIEPNFPSASILLELFVRKCIADLSEHNSSISLESKKTNTRFSSSYVQFLVDLIGNLTAHWGTTLAQISSQRLESEAVQLPPEAVNSIVVLFGTQSVNDNRHASFLLRLEDCIAGIEDSQPKGRKSSKMKLSQSMSKGNSNELNDAEAIVGLLTDMTASVMDLVSQRDVASQADSEAAQIIPSVASILRQSKCCSDVVFK